VDANISPKDLVTTVRGSITSTFMSTHATSKLNRGDKLQKHHEDMG
jgi:hypothetical protein